MWAATNRYRVRHHLAVAPAVFRAISRPLLGPISLPLPQPDRETTNELDQAREQLAVLPASGLHFVKLLANRVETGVEII